MRLQFISGSRHPALKMEIKSQNARPSKQVDRRSHIAIRFSNPFASKPSCARSCGCPFRLHADEMRLQFSSGPPHPALKVETKSQKAPPFEQVDRRSHIAIPFSNPFANKPSCARSCGCPFRSNADEMRSQFSSGSRHPDLIMEVKSRNARPSKQGDRRSHIAIRFRNPLASEASCGRSCGCPV